MQPQGCVLCFRKFQGKIYIYMYFLLGSSLLALLQWLLLLFSALCAVWCLDAARLEQRGGSEGRAQRCWAGVDAGLGRPLPSSAG